MLDQYDYGKLLVLNNQQIRVAIILLNEIEYDLKKAIEAINDKREYSDTSKNAIVRKIELIREELLSAAKTLRGKM